MSFVSTLRVVYPDGSIGDPLPDIGGLQYLDDAVDVGTCILRYPSNGRNGDQLVDRQELALFVDGKELPNSRFTLTDNAGTMISDGITEDVWNGRTLLGRLGEALVLPLRDLHNREDVFTDAEKQRLEQQRQEWMQQAVKDAVKSAKEKAQQHNDRVRERRRGSSNPGQPPSNVDPHLNQWGKKAVRWATNQITNPSQDWTQKCQSFVRQSFGLPGIYGSANAAWQAGRKRTKAAYVDIPGGVPVYWGPNHVALSIGGGQCISTDAIRVGRADVVDIAALGNGVIWSLDWRGWSPDCSGQAIYP